MNIVNDPKIAGTLPRLFRAIQYKIANFGGKAPADTNSEVYRLRPWYHDFSALGARTNFDSVVSPGERVANTIRRLCGKGVLNSGSHAHQSGRDQRLVPMLEAAKALYTKQFGTPPQSFLDTMGADGYYAFYAIRKLGFKRARCNDLEIEHIRRGEAMKQMLKVPELQFVHQNVFELGSEKYDVGMNSGGLYHLNDPEALLKLLRDRVKVLVVLSTVSQRSDSPTHLVTPAPGWQHGSAFSREWLVAATQRAGWRIVQREGFAYTDTVFDGKPEGVELLLCV